MQHRPPWHGCFFLPPLPTLKKRPVTLENGFNCSLWLNMGNQPCGSNMDFHGFIYIYIYTYIYIYIYIYNIYIYIYEPIESAFVPPPPGANSAAHGAQARRLKTLPCTPATDTPLSGAKRRQSPGGIEGGTGCQLQPCLGEGKVKGSWLLSALLKVFNF